MAVNLLPEKMELGVDSIGVDVPGFGATIGTVVPPIATLLEGVFQCERRAIGPDAVLRATRAIEQSRKS